MGEFHKHCPVIPDQIRVICLFVPFVFQILRQWAKFTSSEGRPKYSDPRFLLTFRAKDGTMKVMREESRPLMEDANGEQETDPN
jgi:hypothetical protein